jgi:hypothetical protein
VTTRHHRGDRVTAGVVLEPYFCPGTHGPMETLPLDILLYIIDLLADNADIKSLQILSQACKSLVPLCRKHLFSSLCLHSTLNSESERFSDLLSKNPDLARYVRSLNYRVYNPIGDHVLNILDILKKRSSLQSIQLVSSLIEPLDWNDFHESMQSSLIFLIQLPTVTFLSIRSLTGFPATVLSGCSNLNHIDLRRGEFNLAPPEVNNQVISRSKISTPVSLSIKTDTDGLSALLNSASLHAGGPIVDFSRLRSAQIYVGSRGEID